MIINHPQITKILSGTISDIIIERMVEYTKDDNIQSLLPGVLMIYI